MFSSVRVQLTVWNVVVLMVVLFVCGLALVYRTQAYLMDNLDQSLEDRARPALNPHQPPGPPPGMPPGMMGAEGLSGPGFDPRPGMPLRGLPTNSLPEFWPPGAQGVPPRMIFHPPRLPNDVRVLSMNGPSAFGQAEPFDQAAYRASLSGRTIWATINQDGERWRVYSAPGIGPGGRVDRVVQAEQSLAPIEAEIADLTRVLLALIPLGMIAAALGGAFLAGRALAPVQQIAATADRIQAEDLGKRLPVRGSDEFSRLGRTLNAMLERLQRAFDDQRRFTMDASHELKTPLTVIKAKTSVALTRQRPAESYRAVIETVDRAADQMAAIVQDLLLLAQADSGQLGQNRERVCIRDIAEKAVAGVWAEISAPIQWDIPEPSPVVFGNAGQLTRAMRNVVQNAIDHTPGNGCVIISAVEQAGQVEITVVDNGEGIAREHIAHLAERFYRVDLARSRQTGGTGLGLAIVKSIVDSHGGRLLIESCLGSGTTVRLRLPAAQR